MQKEEEVVSNKGQHLHVGVCEITGALSGIYMYTISTYTQARNLQDACTLNNEMQ